MDNGRLLHMHDISQADREVSSTNTLTLTRIFVVSLQQLLAISDMVNIIQMAFFNIRWIIFYFYPPTSVLVVIYNWL